jgi:uncharacterized RDD family membrane protein YckC
MTTTATHDSLRRNIQVYFLAAPEDQDVCQEIQKFLSPIVRNSPVPIEVNGDFNIPSGADRDKYKQRLFDADVVLALISSDFINNDDIYSRHQKVIERYNDHKTVLVPILVRNCLWKSTPFALLPVLPKNLQPLNNKQFWNSPDDAVTAVVSDIYDSINELTQSEVVQPAPAAKVESTPDLKAPVGTSVSQTEPNNSMSELSQIQSEAVQPIPAAKVESTPDLKAAPGTSISQNEPNSSMNKLSQTQSEAVQPAPAAKAESTPDLMAPVGTSVSQATSQARVSSPIVVDWREKYYRTVMMKRAGAILIDYIFVILVTNILLILLNSFDPSLSAVITLVLYYLIMPVMESSKWQGTIGKRILKLQITNREGERITFFRALWRNIIRSVVLYSYIISFGLLLIPQYFRFKKTRKLVHDELSSTVIGERLASSSEIRVAGNVA